MQTLISTARATLKDKNIDRAWLLVPANSIQAGASYIAEQSLKTMLDPPKVACAYNAGSLLENRGRDNRWKMKQFPIGTSEHCNRFVKWFNDAVAVLATHPTKPSVPYELYLL
ncbi:MAG: transglycosylase SLT domain-containing protein [Candidatus Contendobacter sp.]